MRKNALLYLQKTIILKNNDLESSFDVSENKFWSYKFT